MISQSAGVRATTFSTGLSKVISRPAMSVTVKEVSSAAVKAATDRSIRAAMSIARVFLSFMCFLSPFAFLLNRTGAGKTLPRIEER